MQLNSQELKSLLTVGACGLGGAILYQLGSIYLKQCTDDYKLDPDTEALQSHTDMLHLFHQLAEYRAFNETAYRSAVLSADNLVLLMRQIQARSVTPTLDDVNDAFALYQDSVKQVKKLRAAATAAHNPRAAAAVDILLTKVYPVLQECYIAVHRAVHTAQ